MSNIRTYKIKFPDQPLWTRVDMPDADASKETAIQSMLEAAESYIREKIELVETARPAVRPVVTIGDAPVEDVF